MNPRLALITAVIATAVACTSDVAQSGGDVSSSWFSFGSSERVLTVTSQETGRYRFLVQPSDADPELLEHDGTLEPEVLTQLQALLTLERARHYVTHNPVEDECLRAGGYTLMGIGGGCWLQDELDAVEDPQTKQLLSVLVPLYEEKLEECRSAPTVSTRRRP
jgi:hypothetical protein